MNRLPRSIIALTSIFGLLLTVHPSSVGATPSGDSVSIWATLTASGREPSSVLVTGAIVDYGKAFRANSASRIDAKGRFTKLVLEHGTILLGGTALDPVVRTAKPVGRTQTCSVLASSDEQAPVVSGTKAYLGISGSLVVATSSVLIIPLSKGGQCNTGAGARPVAAWSTVTASGSVTLPSSKN